MSDKHTPTPWPEHVVAKIWNAGISSLVASGDLPVLAAINAIYDGVTSIDARFIVKCVNAHDDLVAASKLAMESTYPTDDMDEWRVVARVALAKAGTP